MAPSKTKLLVVDDHPVVRKGLRSCLAQHPGFAIVGEAANGREAISKSRQLNPDAVLMDIHMPEMDGLEATMHLRKHQPEIKVLILTVDTSPSTVLKIIRAGAHGYALKDSPVQDLITGVESVTRGEAFFSPAVAQHVLNDYVTTAARGGKSHTGGLTAREVQVLRLIAEGFSNKEIAAQLEVSVRTVEAHREHIMRKLQAHNVVDLTRFAIAHGIASLK